MSNKHQLTGYLQCFSVRVRSFITLKTTVGSYETLPSAKLPAIQHPSHTLATCFHITEEPSSRTGQRTLSGVALLNGSSGPCVSPRGDKHPELVFFGRRGEVRCVLQQPLQQLICSENKMLRNKTSTSFLHHYEALLVSIIVFHWQHPHSDEC